VTKVAVAAREVEWWRPAAATCEEEEGIMGGFVEGLNAKRVTDKRRSETRV
jgi:hypothetical protein